MATCAVPICDRDARSGGRGWCQAHYMRWWYTGEVDADRPIEVRNGPVGDRFQRHVKRLPSGCWEWTGTVNRTGYGYFRLAGRPQLAHRVAYTLAYGEPPAGQQIDHLCHNRDKSCAGGWTCLHRRCVNPQHLAVASQSQNQRRGRVGDSVRKRAAAITHCPRGHEYTPQNIYWAKKRGGKPPTRTCRTCRLGDQKAKTYKARGLPDPRRTPEDTTTRIRKMLAEGRLTWDGIAAEAGVSRATVGRIHKRG